MSEDPKYHSPVDVWLAEKFQPFAKIWFEFIRNAFVVALFNYVATKSDSNIVKLFASFTYLLFGLYGLSYIILSHPPIRSSAKNKYVRLGFEVFGFAFAGVAFWYWSDIFQRVIDQIAKVQFK
jgi:hypothetical protein